MEKGFYYDNEGNKQILPPEIQKKVEKLKQIKKEEQECIDQNE